MLGLDFGSGYNPRDGYLTCDCVYSPKLDFVFDREKYKVIDAPSQIFDKIYCRNVIHHVPNLTRLFLEFRRLLKIDGSLMIVEPTRDSFKTNQILDIVWYRFVIPQYDIWFSSKYRDYNNVLKKLGFIEECRGKLLEKEYYVFRRIC